MTMLRAKKIFIMIFIIFCFRKSNCKFELPKERKNGSKEKEYIGK